MNSQQPDNAHPPYDVIVIGGGASGMMAAGRAAELGRRVLLLEKNTLLGEKLKITGGGRCNITNAEEEEHLLLAQYGKAKAFLHSPFSQFGMKDTFSFFDERGLPLVVQARKRAFPNTEKALDVFRLLEAYLKRGRVKVMSGARVSTIIGDHGLIRGVEVNGTTFEASSYILATGGKSHPETGSTGDGFRWLKALGHAVAEPTPTIVPLSVHDAWVKKLAGVSLSFCKITFYADGIKRFLLKGKILFTHFGLSGPLILNAAGRVSDLLHEGAVTASIDAYPDTDLGQLDKRITKVFDANKNKTFKTVFEEIVPHGTAKSLLSLAGVNPETKVHSVTREQRKAIGRLLKALPVRINGLMGYDWAVVADGGVSLSEIENKTMRSKLYKNLFVTGDLLHVVRPSGGFSLQLCWTTGWVAGSNA